jgi:hypothetical protein
MTISQPNPDVGPTGAEVDEFADAPPDAERSDDDQGAEDDEETDPEAKLYSTVPLETEEGTKVIQQQNVGKDNMKGGGEWPDPDTPPEAPAPGAT